MLLFILVTVERVTQLCRDIFYREKKEKTQTVKKKVFSSGSITDMCATILPEHTKYTRPDITDLTVKPRNNVC